MSSTTVTLCADDYGLAPGIGRAIRDLIAAGRLQATGCMTGSPHWPAE
ncbi:MAG TPA: ChbG/HpnK family deacetylase, partial [Candidatus Omnitrophota bacterium]|nr:ChbG/HpnK family deacetylase [Candidatus Omnitrophota bacterium]